MVAAPAGPWAVVATKAEPRESALIGMHGSVTSADQLVPLLTWPRPDGDGTGPHEAQADAGGQGRAAAHGAVPSGRPSGRVKASSGLSTAVAGNPTAEARRTQKTGGYPQG